MSIRPMWFLDQGTTKEEENEEKKTGQVLKREQFHYEKTKKGLWETNSIL